MKEEITEKQLRKAVKVLFERYDEDKNGVLSLNEVMVMLKDSMKCRGKEPHISEMELEHFYEVIDKDNDRKISKDELVCYLGKIAYTKRYNRE